MSLTLRDYFETTDGSRPRARYLATEIAERFSLSAMGVLSGGDVFDATNNHSPPDRKGVERWWEKKVECAASVSVRHQKFICEELVELLGYNPQLLQRMQWAKPIKIQVSDEASPGWEGVSGLPRQLNPAIRGVFWDHIQWPSALIAFRFHALDEPGSTLVVHEFAHAVHYLAMSDAERALIYQFLRPVYGSLAEMDEALAIYTEAEFCHQFSERALRAPGIYGVVRQQWSENHVFTRFIRKLFFPSRALAGPGLKSSTQQWTRFLGR